MNTDELPVGPHPKALTFPHFPARHQAVIFRNWELVPVAALARVRLAAGRPGDALPLLEQAVAFWRDFAPAHEEGARLAALIREVQGRSGAVAP